MRILISEKRGHYERRDLIMNYNLTRFAEAQEYSYADALKEIQNGHKESHWIWYIFPQLKQLGKKDENTIRLL